MGETSRNIYESSREHWDDFRKKKKDSHIWKHHLVHHQGQGVPDMVFKVISSHKTALSRQVSEAVRIRRRGACTLNSKGEYDRCKITRLTIEEGAKTSGLTDTEQANGNTHSEGARGELLLTRRRVVEDKKDSDSLEKITGLVDSQKRGGLEPQGGKRKKFKSRKYELIGDEWGSKEGAKEQRLNCLRRPANEQTDDLGVENRSQPSRS